MVKKEITVLKLGGSLLTDKSIPYKMREEKLKFIANEIKDCIDCGLFEGLIIIHGVGSYGHPPVLKYKLYEGFKNPSQLIHLSETQNIVNKLRSTIAECFLEVGIPVNLMHASSIIVGNRMMITEYMFKALKGFLKIGMVPLIGGDMMFDESMGFSICSGDQLAIVISRVIQAKHLIFATDVPGVFDKDPKIDTNASLINEINIREIDNLIKKLGESTTLDASGKMKGKLQSLILAEDLIKNGLKVSILSMMEINILKNFLNDKDVNATRIIYK